MVGRIKNQPCCARGKQKLKNMRELFVTYEIANLLKKIGFDEPCMAVYNYHYESTMCDEQNKSFAPIWEIQIDKNRQLIPTELRNSNGYLTAPTWGQIQDYIFKSGYNLTLAKVANGVRVTCTSMISGVIFAKDYSDIVYAKTNGYEVILKDIISNRKII
jgi:hypothetical protein